MCQPNYNVNINVNDDFGPVCAQPNWVNNDLSNVNITIKKWRVLIFSEKNCHYKLCQHFDLYGQWSQIRPVCRLPNCVVNGIK